MEQQSLCIGKFTLRRKIESGGLWLKIEETNEERLARPDLENRIFDCIETFWKEVEAKNLEVNSL